VDSGTESQTQPEDEELLQRPVLSGARTSSPEARSWEERCSEMKVGSRFAIFGKKDEKEILCGNCTFPTKEKAEEKLPLYEKIFGVRGYALEIRSF